MVSLSGAVIGRRPDTGYRCYYALNSTARPDWLQRPAFVERGVVIV